MKNIVTILLIFMLCSCSSLYNHTESTVSGTPEPTVHGTPEPTVSDTRPVKILCNVKDAVITVNDQQGYSPFSLELEANKDYFISVTKEGCTTATATLSPYRSNQWMLKNQTPNWKENSPTVFFATLDRSPFSTDTITITCNVPDALVTVGDKQGYSPFSVDLGINKTYSVSVVKEGYKTETAQIRYSSYYKEWTFDDYRNSYTQYNSTKTSKTEFSFTLEPTAYGWMKDIEVSGNSGKWRVYHYVDEFKNPTSEKYVSTQYFDGEFTNSATNGSELSAQVLVNKDTAEIKLLEYGKYPISASSSSDIIVKINYNGQTITFDDVWYSKSTKRLIIKDPLNLFKAFVENSKVSMYVSITDYTKNTYLFDIYTDGFDVAYHQAFVTDK